MLIALKSSGNRDVAVVQTATFFAPRIKNNLKKGDEFLTGQRFGIVRFGGYTDLYFTEDCADPFSPKAVRASMGGIFRVKAHISTRDYIAENLNIPFIIADMNGENVFSFNKKGDFCLVIGNEGNGVSEKIRKKASYTVSIPMENGMESLNASVSAGILMYLLKK